MNVLIIDDEVNIANSIKSILSDEGYNCETAFSGNEGLKKVESFYPDIVLLDVKMSDMNGIDVLERIIAFDNSISVIMISGHSGIPEAVQAMKSGAFEFLEKPLNLSLIKLTVEKAIKYRNLTLEYKRLKASDNEKYQIIGDSERIQELKQIISKVARTDTKVLIRGESGTGKELIAYAIHNISSRRNNAFIKFNSAAIPDELVESELFGYEKGAFTGAVKSKKGKIEEADGGTLFLDEIGDMSLTAQAKILRVIQEGEFERVGGNKTHKIDIRLIAATHRNLEEMIESREFRDDLFYRLNVVPVNSPPLREHPEDIPLLVNHFSYMFSRELKIPLKHFTDEAVSDFKKMKLMGNVRELRNLIERIYILADKNSIDSEDLPLSATKSRIVSDDFWNETKSFQEKKKEFEIRYFTQQLIKHDKNISKTAQALDLHQSNLSRKLKELELDLD